MIPDPPSKGADPRLRAGHAMSLPVLVFVGGVTMALFGSRIILQEIDGQPDMIGYETAKSVGIAWDRAMRSLRTTKPDQFLHDVLRRVEAHPF